MKNDNTEDSYTPEAQVDPAVSSDAPATQRAEEWFVEPLDGGVSSGCLNCGGRSARHPLDGILGVGFGACDVTKDGYPVWWEDTNSEEVPPLLQRFEDLAAVDPDHDWRVSYNAPIWEGVWQRHGVGEWNLIERGEGFA